MNGIQEVSGSIPLISTNPNQNEHGILNKKRICVRFVLFYHIVLTREVPSLNFKLGTSFYTYVTI